MELPILPTPRLVLRPFVGDDHPYLDGMAESWIASHVPAWAERKFLTLAVTTPESSIASRLDTCSGIPHPGA